MHGTTQESRLLRGWAVAAAVALAAALSIVVYCIVSGQFDFKPIVRPTPSADGITYEEGAEEVWTYVPLHT